LDNTETLHRLAQLMVTRTALAIELLDSLAPDEVPAGIAEVIRCRHALMSGRIRPTELEPRLMALELPPDWVIRRDLVRVTAAFFLRDFELAERLLNPILQRIGQFPADIIGPATVTAGRIFAAKGDLTSALVWNYKGLGMLGDQLPVVRASILNNIACEHAGAGSDITAAELFHRALEIYTREQYWPPALLVASNLADIMMDDGRHEEAVQFLLGWERAHPEVFHLPEANFFLAIMALAKVRTGRIKEAKARLASITVNKTDMDQRFMLLLVGSYIDLAENRLEPALNQRLALRQETHHERGLVAILEPLSDVYAALGNYKLAYDVAVERREILARLKKAIREISDIEVEARRRIRIK
jgi:tetratricopeptide (TPR) repeat protein